jgi:hypothetical protein
MSHSFRQLWNKSARCALAAVLLVVLAWPAMPQPAAEADDAASSVKVALTIVDTTATDDAGNVVGKTVYNGTVDGLTSSNTVADMLKKAGIDYDESYGSPAFEGKGDNKDTGANWVTEFNGSNDDHAKAQLSAKLVDGGHYQYIYSSTGDFSYDDNQVTAQLTVVDAMNNNTVAYNDLVSGLTTDSTVTDLLNAAGVTWKDGGGYPNFNGKGYDLASGAYWMDVFNGSSANYSSALLSATLIDGGHYQYVYTNDSSYPYLFSYSSAIPDKVTSVVPQVSDPLAGYTPATPETPAEPSKPDTPSTPTLTPADEGKLTALLDNLANTYREGGSGAALEGDQMANNRYNAAIALRAMDRASDVAKNEVVASIAQSDKIAAGTMAKYITMLTAAGVDCTQVDIDGTTRNLVKEMEEAEEGASLTATDYVCILPVYSAQGYTTQTDAALTPEKIIDAIIDSADATTGLVGYTGYPDSQTTAQAVLALLPYKDANKNVADFIDKAKATIMSMQNDDGGFSYSYGDKTSNADATAEICAALDALGYDVNGADTASATSGKTPMYYLLSQAKSDLTGYESNWDSQMLDSDAMLALAAYKDGKTANVLVFGPTGATVNPQDGDVTITFIDAGDPHTADDNQSTMVTAAPGSTIELPGQLVDRSDAQFEGWNTAENHTGTLYEAGATYTVPDEDVTLYAQWGDAAATAGSATAMPQTGDAFPAALVVVLLAAGAAAGVARAKVRKE